MFKKNLPIALIMLLALPTMVLAQSMSIDPASATVGVGDSASFDILVSGITDENTAQVRMSVPANLEITNYAYDPAMIINIGCYGGGSALFGSDSICVDSAAGAIFTEGQRVGTVTVQGVSEGDAAITFDPGGSLTGATINPFSGPAGTYTVGAGSSSSSSSGTLPDTALEAKDILLIFMGLSFITLALAVNRSPYLQKYLQFMPKFNGAPSWANESSDTFEKVWEGRNKDK